MHEKRAWRQKNPVKSAYADKRHDAKRRNIPFSLTLEEFTAFAISSGYIEGKGHFGACFHLDRIDPQKGYEAGNIQVLTCSENTAKGNRERHFKESRPDLFPEYANQDHDPKEEDPFGGLEPEDIFGPTEPSIPF